jgi:hypothetical protein
VNISRKTERGKLNSRRKPRRTTTEFGRVTVWISKENKYPRIIMEPYSP